jgi:hypothetical protein
MRTPHVLFAAAELVCMFRERRWLVHAVCLLVTYVRFSMHSREVLLFIMSQSRRMNDGCTLYLLCAYYRSVFNDSRGTLEVANHAQGDHVAERCHR